MLEHVEADPFLQPDHPLDLRAHPALVLRVVESPGPVRGPVGPDLTVLRERADGRGRHRPELQPRPLRRGPLGRCPTPVVVCAQGVQPGPHPVVALAGPIQAGAQRGRGRELLGHYRPPLAQGAAERSIEVAAPHIAAVDDPGEHSLVLQRRKRRRGAQVLDAGNQVEPDRLDRACGSSRVEKSAGTPAGFASSRKVIGPSNTGRVRTPAASASLNSSRGLRSANRSAVSGPSSGTK